MRGPIIHMTWYVRWLVGAGSGLRAGSLRAGALRSGNILDRTEAPDFRLGPNALLNRTLFHAEVQCM
jgi:hypothetical protein